MKYAFSLPGGMFDTQVNAYDPKFNYPDDVATHREAILPDQLEEVFAEHGVFKYLVTEVLRDSASRRLFFGLSRKGLYPKGLVPLVDLGSAGLQEDLSSFSPNPHVVAVRDMLDSLGAGELNTDAIRDGLIIAADYRPVVNLLVKSSQLKELGDLLASVDLKRRGLTVALDHLGWPDPDSNITDWENPMRHLARNPSVVVKASFLPPQAYHVAGRFDQQRFIRLLSYVYQTFGIQRMLFATDFPNSLVQTSYGTIIHTVLAWMDSVQMGNSGRASFFSANAERIYGPLRRPNE